MVNVFCDSVASGSGNFQVVKKIVVTVGKFKDYIDEIQKSYELGFPPYRLHTNVYLVLLFALIVFLLDDAAKMEIGNRRIATDKISSELI